MKKLSILLIGLLLVTGFTFAQEVTVAGDATLTFGVDLNNNATGFKNEASSSISLDWLSGDAESGSQGWISLSGWEISFASGDDDNLTVGAPTVEAGWMFAPVTVTIYSAPTFDGDNAVGFVYSDDDDPDDVVSPALSAANATDAEDAYSSEGTWYMHDVVEGDADDIPDNAILIDTDAGVWELYFVPDTIPGNTDTPGFQGLTVSADLGMATLDFMIASDGTWAENAINAYALGVGATAMVGPATVNVAAYYGPFAEPGDIGVTAGVDATVGPLTVDLGFDFWAPDETWDASLGLSATVAGLGLGSTTYVADGDVMQIDQEVTLDASGVVAGLGLTNTFQMVDIMEFYGIFNETALSYDVDGIKPFATFGYLVETAAGEEDATTMSLTAGVELSGMVENTVFTIQYASDDLAEDGDKGAITVAGKISF